MHGWASTLYEHGYRVFAIERSIRVGCRIVVPDIMLLNEEAGHILIIDCKGGSNIKPDQDSRYARVSLTAILEGTRLPCEACEACLHMFAYAIDETHEERIRAHTDFALIVFGDHVVRGIGDLGHEPPTRELQGGVSLDDTVPQFIPYPFSINDGDKDIDACVKRSMQALSLPLQDKNITGNRATAAMILRNAHPFHVSYAPTHMAELAEATRLGAGRVLASHGVTDRPRSRQDGSR